MEKMICPECGKEFDGAEYMIGENGNPICSDCWGKENLEDTDEQEERL